MSSKIQSASQFPVSTVEPRLLRVKEAAAYLGATVWFMRSLAWNRAVPHIVFGKRLLFDRADLDRYLESQKKAAA